MAENDEKGGCSTKKGVVFAWCWPVGTVTKILKLKTDLVDLNMREIGIFGIYKKSVLWPHEFQSHSCTSSTSEID